jgi:hypothetical protein
MPEGPTPVPGLLVPPPGDVGVCGKLEDGPPGEEPDCPLPSVAGEPFAKPPRAPGVPSPVSPLPSPVLAGALQATASNVASASTHAILWRIGDLSCAS